MMAPFVPFATFLYPRQNTRPISPCPKAIRPSAITVYTASRIVKVPNIALIVVHDGSRDSCSNSKLAPIPVKKPKSFDAKNAPSTAFAMIPDATFNANAGAAFRATCWTAISDEIKPGPKYVMA